MNKLMHTLLIASFSFGSYSAFAGNATNTQDAQEGLAQDESLTTEQATSTKKNNTSKKSMTHKNRKGSNSADYKMMDSNSDGMISKEEYMMHHETAYGKMKQTNGSVSLKDMNAQMNVGTTKGNKIQPSSLKDAPPEARPEAKN